MFLALPALLTLTLASALPALQPRAGGPIPQPIPSTCSLERVNPVHPAPAFKPSPAFAAANQVYAYYLPQDTTFDEGAEYEKCLQSCYGFGEKGTCVGSVWAHNVSYTAYGTPNVGTACLFFGKPLVEADLEAVTDGSYSGARAVNIKCPAA